MKDFVFGWPWKQERITVSNDRGRIVATTNHIIFRGRWGCNALIVEHVDASYEARGIVDGLRMLLEAFEVVDEEVSAPPTDRIPEKEIAVGSVVWLVEEDSKIYMCAVVKVWTYSLTGSKAVRLHKIQREGRDRGEVTRAFPSDTIHESLVAASKALLAAKARTAEAARAAARQAQEEHALAIEEVDLWIEAEKRGGAR